jgi:hypothetical protein
MHRGFGSRPPAAVSLETQNGRSSEPRVAGELSRRVARLLGKAWMPHRGVSQRSMERPLYQKEIGVDRSREARNQGAPISFLKSELNFSGRHSRL